MEKNKVTSVKKPVAWYILGISVAIIALSAVGVAVHKKLTEED